MTIRAPEVGSPTSPDQCVGPRDDAIEVLWGERVASTMLPDTA